MKVVELQEKINGLKNYISGLKQIISAAERTITTTEIQIMRICKHESGMEYVVGLESAWDPDDGAEQFHCEYCGVCNVLFVIESFGYYGKPRQAEYRTVGLNGGLLAPYFIDRKTMWKGE